MDACELAREIPRWIKAQVEGVGMKGVVVGISGGVDSAVAAALAQRGLGDAVLGLILPCQSQAGDLERAQRVVDHLGLVHRSLDLSPVYDLLREILPESTQMAWANIKPRLRMVALYHMAAKQSCLVLGTGNRSELDPPYFTQYGDGGVDLLPLAALFKSQVQELAEELGIPREIIDVPPSAGLWPGQTDEGEMGVTYAEIEEFLSGREDSLAPGVSARIRELINAGRHKSEPVPVFKPRG